MEKSRMNLPKGPDTLCYDMDEFMKVRPEGLRSLSRVRWPVFLSLRGLLGLLGRACPESASCGTSLPSQTTLMSITLYLTVRSKSSWKHLEMTWSSTISCLKQPWLSSSTRTTQPLSTCQQTCRELPVEIWSRRFFLRFTYVEPKHQNDPHNQAGANGVQQSIWIF